MGTGRYDEETDLFRDFITLVRCEVTFFALFAMWGYIFEMHRYPQAVAVAVFLALLWRGRLFHWYLAGLAGLLIWFGLQQNWAVLIVPPVLGLLGWWIRHLVRATRSLGPVRDKPKSKNDDPLAIPLTRMGMYGWGPYRR